MIIDPNLAYLALGLMVLGYALYIGQRQIEPNPTTWFMFSYGTILLTVLEFDRGASWELLALPIACSVGGVIVAFRCWRQGKLRWPKDWEDRFSFLADLCLTALYVGAWGGLFFGIFEPEYREVATLVFLVASNLTALTAFTPLLRHAKRDPTVERALPWLVWALSYATLGVVTYAEEGFWTELMIYPVLNTVLHGAVGLLALPYRRQRKLREAELNEGYQAF